MIAQGRAVIRADPQLVCGKRVTARQSLALPQENGIFWEVAELTPVTATRINRWFSPPFQGFRAIDSILPRAALGDTLSPDIS